MGIFRNWVSTLSLKRKIISPLATDNYISDVLRQSLLLNRASDSLLSLSISISISFSLPPFFLFLFPYVSSIITTE